MMKHRVAGMLTFGLDSKANHCGNGDMDGAKYRTVMEKKQLEAAKDVELV